MAEIRIYGLPGVLRISRILLLDIAGSKPEGGGYGSSSRFSSKSGVFNQVGAVIGGRGMHSCSGIGGPDSVALLHLLLQCRNGGIGGWSSRT